MALRFASSFQYASPTPSSPKEWSASGDTIGVTDTLPRFTGDRYMNINGANTFAGNSGYVRKIIGGTEATAVVSFGYTRRAGMITGAPRLITLQDGTTDHVYLKEEDSILKVYRGDGTLLGTGSGTLVGTGIWQQVELKVTVHNSSGIVRLWLDNILILDLSSQDTQNGGSAQINSFNIGGTAGGYFGGNNTGNDFSVSDFIFMDTTGSFCNDRLGPRRVQPLRGTGAGFYSQWTPSAGSNYQNVDETPPNDDTDYNETATVNNIDSFTTGTVATGATVDAVNCKIYCKTTDGGSAAVRGFVRSGGVDGTGTENGVPSSYAFLQSPIYVDPNTGLAFTAANLNSAEKGYKRTA